MAINFTWAALVPQGSLLEVTADGDFVLRQGTRVKLAGRRGKLEVRLSALDPAKLGVAWIGDGRTSVAIETLTDRDLAELAAAFPDHGHLSAPEET